MPLSFWFYVFQFQIQSHNLHTRKLCSSFFSTVFEWHFRVWTGAPWWMVHCVQLCIHYAVCWVCNLSYSYRTHTYFYSFNSKSFEMDEDETRLYDYDFTTLILAHSLSHSRTQFHTHCLFLILFSDHTNWWGARWRQRRRLNYKNLT